MKLFPLPVFLLLYLMSRVESQGLPTETSNNPQMSDGRTGTDGEQKNVDLHQGSPPVLNKRKRKQLARQNKRAITNTREAQEKVFGEMWIIIEEALTDENTRQFFVQIIEQFRTVVETQTALKSVHWVQNEMNRYLVGPNSSKVKTDFESMVDAYTATDAGEDTAAGDFEISNDSIYTTEFFRDANSLLVNLVQTPNVERVIRNEFDRITKLLIARQISIDV